VSVTSANYDKRDSDPAALGGDADWTVTTTRLRAPRTGFESTVAGAELADLIQMHARAEQPQTYRIEGGEVPGYLCLQAGRILSVSYGTCAGLEALAQLLSIECGTFEPCDRPPPDPAPFALAVEVALLRAAVLQDERPVPDEPLEAPLARYETLPRLPVLPPPALPPKIPRLAATSERAAANKPQPPLAERDDLPMVRLSADGQVVAVQGRPEERLVDATAYARRVAAALGELRSWGAPASVWIGGGTRAFLVWQARLGATLGATGDSARVERLRNTARQP
jgi:hypothetical protein